MADVNDKLVQINGSRRYVARCYNVYADTGGAVILVDKSTLIGVEGVAPSKLVLEEISWDIQGYTSVKLAWDHTTDDEIIILGAGSGSMSWKDVGGLVDPGSAGDTGDILATTSGTTVGSSYTITLVVRLKD
jgi:hypothetical protein